MADHGDFPYVGLSSDLKTKLGIATPPQHYEDALTALKKKMGLYSEWDEAALTGKSAITWEVVPPKDETSHKVQTPVVTGHSFNVVGKVVNVETIHDQKPVAPEAEQSIPADPTFGVNVTLDGKGVAWFGKKSHAQKYAKIIRATLKANGEKYTGRVVVS